MIKRNIFLLYAISLLQGMVFYGSVATLYRQAQGVSVFQITVIESISLGLCLLLELPWGVVADKIGYRRTMIFCCVLYFLSKIVFWQARGFGGFLLERVMLSVVMAGMSGVDTGMLYLSCRKGESQRVFGVYNSLLTAGLLVAALVFTVFVGGSYQLAGFLTVLSYGAAALLSLWLVEVRPETASRFTAHEFLALLRKTLRNPSLLLLLIGIALFNETHQTITVFLSQLQYTACGLSPRSIGGLYLILTVAGMCGTASARLTQKIGTARFAALLYTAAAAACLLLAVTRSVWLSAAGVLLLRVACSLFQPLQMRLQNEQVQTENRATALSINAVIIDSAGVATNLAFGKLADTALSGAMLLGSALCAIGGVLFFAWYRSRSALAQRG